MNRNLFSTFGDSSLSGNVYLDNAGTTLKLSSMINSVSEFYHRFAINSHTTNQSKDYLEVSNSIEQTRKLVGRLINCNSNQVCFTASSTLSLNVLALALSTVIDSSETILTTKLEHSSNLFPWFNLRQKTSCSLEYIKLKDDFSIDIEQLKEIITEKTRILTLFHVSNSFGTTNKISQISKVVKEINQNCLIIIDACQSITNEKIDLEEWEIDALVFSAHKAFGPTGLGILWVSEKLSKLLPELIAGGGKDYSQNYSSKEIFRKFEAGTLPLAQIFSFRQSLKFLIEKVDWEKEKKRRKYLIEFAVEQLKKIDGVEIYNQKLSESIIIFNVKNFHAQDVCDYLAKNSIFVRSGGFCVPFFREVSGVESALRISISIYNNKSDLEKVIKALKKITIEELIW